MSALSQASIIDDSTALEGAVNEAIASCDGDLRATIRALLLVKAYLEEEVERNAKGLSHGYRRRGRRIQ